MTAHSLNLRVEEVGAFGGEKPTTGHWGCELKMGFGWGVLNGFLIFYSHHWVELVWGCISGSLPEYTLGSTFGSFWRFSTGWTCAPGTSELIQKVSATPPEELRIPSDSRILLTTLKPMPDQRLL